MDVEEVNASLVGFDHDRRWMIVDKNNRFITQRQLPELALIEAKPTHGGVQLSFGNTLLGTASATDEHVEAVIWRDRVLVGTVDPAIDRNLSAALGRTVRLVHFGNRSERTIDPDWGRSPVALADGYPVLLTTLASLDALNDAILEKGGEPVSMARFRPNIVVEEAAAWDEDGWGRLAIGDGVEIELVKPCDRCKVTTVNQETGRFDGDEPLATLRHMRSSADARVPGILFGWNAVVRKAGPMRLGDDVCILERRPRWPIRPR